MAPDAISSSLEDEAEAEERPEEEVVTGRASMIITWCSSADIVASRDPQGGGAAPPAEEEATAVAAEAPSLAGDATSRAVGELGVAMPPRGGNNCAGPASTASKGFGLPRPSISSSHTVALCSRSSFCHILWHLCTATLKYLYCNFIHIFLLIEIITLNLGNIT